MKRIAIKPTLSLLVGVCLALCLAGLTLVGCASETNASASNSGSEGTASQELTKVKVSEFRNMNWVAAYVAQANGYYEEEGLDVEFVLYSDGPIAFQGMHGGDSDFCLLSQEPVLKAQEEGLESELIYTALDTRLYGFVSNPDITEVADLKGKAIFAGMQGSAPYSFVSSILREAGLDPEKDVTFVNMDYGASLAALEQGQIQATYINTDNRIEVENVDVNVLVDTARAEDAEKYLKADVFPGEIICTSKAFADANPQTVQSFVNAISKASEWMNEASAEEIAQVLTPYFEGLSQDVLTQKAEIVKSALTQTGRIDEASENAVQEFVINCGTLSGQIPYEEIVDMTYVDAYQNSKA